MMNSKYRLPVSRITINDLENLIKEKKHENGFIDYKRTVPNQLADTICSFLNTNGGQVVIGMKEDNGVPTEITGIDKKSLSKISQYIDNIKPCPQVEIMAVPIKDDLVVYVIFMPRCKGSWYLSKGKFYVRIGDRSVPLESEDEIEKWKKNHQENQSRITKGKEQGSPLHQIRASKNDFVDLLEKMVEIELKKYINQGELIKKENRYHWLFSTKIIEENQYSYNRDGGKQLRTYQQTSKKNLIILTGKRGSGKTVATIQLQQEMLDQLPEEKSIPIRIVMRKFSLENNIIYYDGHSLNENHITLVNLVCSWATSAWNHLLPSKDSPRQEIVSLQPEFIEETIFLVIFDGWDELPRDLSDEFDIFLKTLIEKHPVVITTRKIPKHFSLANDSRTTQLVTCLPSDADISAYFRHRWAFFGYKVNEEQVQHLKKLPKNFRSPFEMHALSLLPPSSAIPHNSAALYRRMVYCTILWEQVKNQKYKNFASFKDYEDVLEYLNQSSMGQESGKTIMETILGSDQDNSLFDVIGKIAYDAYWKDLPYNYYHQVIKLNPFTKYFVDRLLDVKSSRFLAILADYHLYPYFAVEHIFRELLKGNKLDIPAGDVLDLFEELLEIDNEWKKTVAWKSCKVPQDVVFEFFAEDKIIGQRKLKANFSGDNYLEQFRLSTGIPEYAKTMREELLSHYKENTEESSKKKLFRSLLKDLIFDPPQHYFSMGYDSIIKDMSEQMGVTKDPSYYKKAIYEIHGIEDDNNWLKIQKDLQLANLIANTPYQFTFHWLFAYLEEQITPLLAETMWKRLKTKNDCNEIKEVILANLLRIDYEPAVQEYLLENLRNNNVVAFNEKVNRTIRSPLPLDITKLADETKHWLQKHSDPRQIDSWWLNLTDNDYSIPSIRIKLSQKIYSPKLIKESTSILMKMVKNNKALEVEKDLSAPFKTDKLGFRDLFEPLLQSMFIRSEKEARNLFLNVYSNAITEWKSYFIKLVKNWNLVFLKSDLVEIIENESDDLVIDIIYVLGHFNDKNAIHHLRKLWDERKITDWDCLQILHILPNIEEWPWKEFIVKSASELWTEYHQSKWNDYFPTFNEKLLIYFEQAEDTMLDKIARILNDESTKKMNSLYSLTKKFIPFSSYNLARIEKLFNKVNLKVKEQLFIDLTSVYYEIEWKKPFLEQYAFEIEDLHVLSRILNKLGLPDEQKRSLIRKSIINHIGSFKLDERGELDDFHSLDTIIENYSNSQNLDSEDMEFFENLWENLPGDKLYLPSLTQTLISEENNCVIDALVDKIANEENIENISSLLRYIPRNIVIDTFWKKIVGVLPSSSNIHQILLNDSRSLNRYFRELSGFSHPEVLDYLIHIWKTCPDELLFTLLGVIKYTLIKNSIIPREFIVDRFKELPIKVVWRQLENWSIEEKYLIPIDKELFKELLILKYKEIKISKITDSRKEAIRDLLSRVHQEDLILSLKKIYELVRNPPESRATWETKWENTLYIHSELLIEDVWEIIITSNNDDRNFSQKNLQYLVSKYEQEIKKTLTSERRKDSIRQILKNTWGREEQEKMNKLYQLVKRPPKQQEYWERQWNKEEETEGSDELDFYSADHHYQRLDKLVEEGCSLQSETAEEFTEYRNKLFTLDNDDFHKVINKLASAGKALLALNLGYERIQLVREAGQGFHGDGTGFYDFQAPINSLRDIILLLAVSGGKIPYDKDGIILEELLRAVSSNPIEKNLSSIDVSENSCGDLVELDENIVFQVLDNIPRQMLYPFIILYGFKNFFETIGISSCKCEWTVKVYKYLIERLREVFD